MVHEETIAILAMGPSRVFCDWNVKEIWSVNNGYKQVQEMHGHISKVFLAHTQVYRRDTKEPVFNWAEMNSLADAGIEIINTHRVKGLKAKIFPMKRISEKFGANMYFSDTVAYMISYALDSNTTGCTKDGTLRLTNSLTLKLYGVDMQETEEYGLEKGGLEYWIGYAQGLGVTVELTTYLQGCNLMRTHNGIPYGNKTYKLKDIDPFGLLKIKHKQGHVEIELNDKTLDGATPATIR
ncbi:hypothetical protein KKH13_04475 [Patescibacteria group bacterium]|nr:hypothetical protein [Patescibacteria group bacterium]